MQVDASAEYTAIAICITLSMLVGGLLWRWLHHVRRRLKLKRRFRHALAAEIEAPALLQELGYEVLGAQVSGSYIVELDTEPMHVPLRADYLVAKAGYSFVAEVKSGKLAPKLTSAATRRQLLEYSVAFQVDGVLLVDAESRRVHQVVFPGSTSTAVSPEPSPKLLLLSVALLLALAFYCVMQFTMR